MSMVGMLSAPRSHDQKNCHLFNIVKVLTYFHPSWNNLVCKSVSTLAHGLCKKMVSLGLQPMNNIKWYQPFVIYNLVGFWDMPFVLLIVVNLICIICRYISLETYCLHPAFTISTLVCFCYCCNIYASTCRIVRYFLVALFGSIWITTWNPWKVDVRWMNCRYL